MVLDLLNFFPHVFICAGVNTRVCGPFSGEFVLLTVLVITFANVSDLIFGVFCNVGSQRVGRALLVCSRGRGCGVIL